MGRYIWQRTDWPKFRWKSEYLLQKLGQARKSQGKILAQADLIGLETQAHFFVEEAFTTSAIEGESLDRKTLRSSVARRLGLPTAGLPPLQRQADGLIEILLDATMSYDKSLTVKRLHAWHSALFPTRHSGITKIQVAKWRTGKEPMQVVSGSIGKEKIHYKAPPSKSVADEMKVFLDWWSKPPDELDGLLRAGIAHFWFVSIHPYDDGNGRIARAITDMALAQDERIGQRLYSLSSQINKEKKQYYEILGKCQKQTSDISLWLGWFLEMFMRSTENSQIAIQKAVKLTKFWKFHAKTELNARQVKIINLLLEVEPKNFEGGLTNKKYVKLTKISSETAKRDLSDLEKKGLIKRNPGGGRSISYSLICP